MNRINLIRFGSYRFQNVGTASPTFGGVAASVVRLPGMDGGVDNYGTGRAPDEVGDVRMTLHLGVQPWNRAGMTQLRRDLLVMKAWGYRPLWYQPADLSQPAQWCSARINNVGASENAAEGTDHLQAISVNFQVAFPRWRSRPNQVYLGQVTLDGDVALVDQPQVYLNLDAELGAVQLSLERCTAFVKHGTELNLLNYGNAPMPARVTIMPSRVWFLNEGLKLGEPGVMIGGYGSLALRWPGVRILNEWGDVISRFRWKNTLTFNEQLTVDAHDRSVKWTHWPNFNESGYPDFDRLADDGFIMMQPGQNRLVVEGEFDGPFGFLKVDYDDGWF